MLNKARIRNKMIQQFYRPNKGGVFSRNTVKTIDEMDKELEKTLSLLFRKKKRKKSAGKKSDDSKDAKASKDSKEETKEKADDK